MHKISTKEHASNLRKEGYSYPYISKVTGVSKSTLSSWLSEIFYAPNSEMVQMHGKAIAAANLKKVQIRQESQEKMKEESVIEIGELSERDLFIFGLGLYLGEGSKTHDTVCIVNADPQIIKASIEWFMSLGVNREQISPRIHLYPDNDIDKSLQFWSETTSIPRVQFQKTYIDTRADKKSRNHKKLPFGTLHVLVRSRGRKEFGVIFSRKIRSWGQRVLDILQTRD